MKFIDPHLHLFDRQKGKYGWLQTGNPPFWQDKAVIQRDFSEADLQVSAPAELAGFVHVEAGFDNQAPWREIEWLESTCQLPFRSIACADLTLSSEAFSEQVTRLKTLSSVVGVRHILDNDAVALLSNQQVKRNLTHLEKEGLIFEAQFDANDDRAVAAFLDVIGQLPSLNVVLNHAGFPPPADSSGWKENIGKLSGLNNLWVKASGWEMTDRHFPVKAIAQTVETLVAAFGHDRVMLASNFPLTLFRTSYTGIWQDYLALDFPKEALHKIMYQNASTFYRL
ncbi:hypothetical protein D515_03851 [Grimontia indica]|uniref:Amidohydrolase-related domain-containing protein n=1 Tax=Grimontia indica TaxID=1056512 RepID=R1GMV9_9GAMM|nr:amidohydrolase family protein [Grimontia indica]EOD77478.1 hypothetical protein D515_03851 [Grimontia indica]